MKILSKSLLVVYLLVLLWLILFKFSVDLPAALSNNNLRLLNLLPFANYSSGNIRELFYNFLVFIPFGLFLSINLKQAGFWQKLAILFLFSLSMETIQYSLALGAADITDLISNTTGGLLGLGLYELGKQHLDAQELDKYITVGGTILLLSSLSFLGVLFASGVRIQSPHQPQGERPQLPRLRQP